MNKRVRSIKNLYAIDSNQTIDTIFAIYNEWIKYDDIQKFVSINLRDYVDRWSDRSIDWNKQ